MTYEIDYAAAETKGCSSRITIGNKIFYIKLFKSNLPTRYLVADQKGLIIKEISKNEFEFWLRTLADKEDEIEQIGNKLSLGKRYLR